MEFLIFLSFLKLKKMCKNWKNCKFLLCIHIIFSELNVIFKKSSNLFFTSPKFSTPPPSSIGSRKICWPFKICFFIPFKFWKGLWTERTYAIDLIKTPVKDVNDSKNIFLNKWKTHMKIFPHNQKFYKNQIISRKVQK